MQALSAEQYFFVYNAFSFTLAAMAAATIFLWLGRSQVGPAYKTALTISGLVTFIAAYHYWRIFAPGRKTLSAGARHLFDISSRLLRKRSLMLRA